MKTVISLIALLAQLAAGSAIAQGFDHEYKAWDALVKKHVVLIDGGKASRVRYDGFAEDRAALTSYLDSLSRVTKQQFTGWSKAQRMAFLINAYNAFTIEKILMRYPDIDSIWDFGKLFSNPFKDRFFRLLGTELSLDDIEHGMLRRPGAYDEPRVHFAANCASIGCPMLREEPYVAASLEAQLEEQTRRFLSDRTRNRFDPRGGRLEVSRIFDWFEADWTSGYRGFEGKSPPLHSRRQFLATYADLLADNPGHRRVIRAQKVEIAFLDYDWGLNDATR
ncbi:MAG: DUF547 domain-containing protein [Betaproteobacteria bacterium]|nr:DUF547 domain-containing protein [Betaproteobacteria bacterium]MDH3438490.1 DUF547 domain-containing protein [Betaproteobacteria bacterium]